MKTFAALAAICVLMTTVGTSASEPRGLERRCGWISNPTPPTLSVARRTQSRRARAIRVRSARRSICFELWRARPPLSAPGTGGGTGARQGEWRRRGDWRRRGHRRKAADETVTARPLEWLARAQLALTGAAGRASLPPGSALRTGATADARSSAPARARRTNTERHRRAADIARRRAGVGRIRAGPAAARGACGAAAPTGNARGAGGPALSAAALTARPDAVARAPGRRAAAGSAAALAAGASPPAEALARTLATARRPPLLSPTR